jgi:hypothetical protein
VSLEDDEFLGIPSTSKMTESVEKIRELIHEYCRRTIHGLPENSFLNRKFEHDLRCLTLAQMIKSSNA